MKGKNRMGVVRLRGTKPWENPVKEKYHTVWDQIPPTVKTGPRVGRNEPCPCGSGVKFKRCHGGGS